MREYLEALSEVLKYGRTNWEAFQHLLADQPHHRWGGGAADTTLRGAAADVYEEDTGDGKGADLLRDPNQHVVVRDGRVRRGVFTNHHLNETLDEIRDHLLQHYSGDGLFDHIGFDMPVVDVPDRTTGHMPVRSEAAREWHSLHPSQVGQHVVHILKRRGERDMTGAETHILESDSVFQSLLEQLRTSQYEGTDYEPPEERQ